MFYGPWCDGMVAESKTFRQLMRTMRMLSKTLVKGCLKDTVVYQGFIQAVRDLSSNSVVGYKSAN